MRTDWAAHIPAIYRLSSFVLIPIIVFGSLLAAVSPARAYGPSNPPQPFIPQRQQIEEQIQRASHALILKGGVVGVDRLQLAGMNTNLRNAIEQLIRALNAGKMGLAVVSGGKLELYGNRAEVLRQLQEHQRETQRPNVQQKGTQPSWYIGTRLSDGWLYVWLDADWTGFLKNRNLWIVYAITWFYMNIMCNKAIACWAAWQVIAFIWNIIDTYLIPLNPGSFKLAFHRQANIWLLPYKWDQYWNRWTPMGEWRNTGYWIA